MTEEQKQFIRDNKHKTVRELALEVHRCDKVVRRFMVREGINNFAKRNVNLELNKYAPEILKFQGICGTYLIKNNLNSKYYIGVSCDIGKRLKQHIANLSKNRHINKGLQTDWDAGHIFSFELVFQGDLYEAYETEANLIINNMGQQDCYNQTSINIIPELKQKQIDNFWSRTEVDSIGCIIWTGRCDRGGYGKVGIGEKDYRAHRISYYLSHKDPYSLQVCHTCDNRKCVNPDHLFLGTGQDNTKDMHQKGRSGNKRKISIEAVNNIRGLYSIGLNYSEIARKTGISRSTIGKYIKNEDNTARTS